VPARFSIGATAVAAAILSACGGNITTTPVTPSSATLTGTFDAATLSVQQRARQSFAIGAIGATLYTGTSATGTLAFTTCSVVTNGTASLSVTAPLGLDTIVIVAASSCPTTASTAVAQFQGTATVSAGMTTLAQAFGGGAAIVLVPVTPTPSPTPPGAVGLSPNSLAFINVGAGFAQSSTISEAFYSGSFTIASTTCAGIATGSISGASITVTPVAAGSCAFTIDGAAGQSATLSVGVTTSTLGGS
jgi:hypothetical protein